MRIRNLIIYNVILITIILATADVVLYQLTGDHLIGTLQTTTVFTNDAKCTNKPPPQRPSMSDIQLKVVAEYEAACNSAFIDDMMIFTNMPISSASAQEAADKMTVRLKAFKEFGITPMVVMEPDSEWGLVDFHEFATGFYDNWIADYFERLKTNGINDQSLGIWIPFPEPQMEFWNNNANPDNFANSVNRYFKILRNVFPKGKTAILLDSQVGDESQSSRLLAYTRLIDNSLIDLAGLQGFPWHPQEEDDKRASVTSASVFAPASVLEEVAKSVGTKKVLFNIGTYRHRKSVRGSDIAITTAERQSTLDSIVHEADILKKADYDVTVNLFSGNKYDGPEGVDWSYWQEGEFKSSSQTPLFTNFIHDLKQRDITVSIFDSRE